MPENRRAEVAKIIAMRKAFNELKKRQRENIGLIEDYLPKLREIRSAIFDNLDSLLSTAISNLEGNGIKVVKALNSEEAIRHVLEVIGDDDVVVKSKSNTTREINLVKALESRGIEVVETDIGDRIVQIMNESPSHPTGPASHLSAGMIAEFLSARYNRKISGIGEIVKVIREDIIDAMNRARVGISGANAITAEGAIVVLHNEGNISEIFSRAEHWIVVAGIDKLYRSVEEAMISAKVQSFFATGKILPSFVEVISGVSKTADVEKKLVKGVSIPENVTLILLDNGRREVIESGFRELLYCIGCGNCVANCPAHAVHGNEFTGGRFALLEALSGRRSRDMLKYCLSCRKCKKNCPLSIDIPGMISRVREGSEIYNFIYSHYLWLLRRFEIEVLKRSLGL